MLRTRKKDINLRPNRILDKKSSRGMLYENEELRLRTIHINEEVDKGQSNIKKLRKENNQLKREIWSLRDECEKLEGMLKRVYGNIDEIGSSEDLENLLETDEAMPSYPTFQLDRNFIRRESGFTDKSCESEEDTFSGSDEVELNMTGPSQHVNDESKSSQEIVLPEAMYLKVDVHDEPLICEDASSTQLEMASTQKDDCQRNTTEYIPPSEIFASDSPPVKQIFTPLIEITPASNIIENAKEEQDFPWKISNTVNDNSSIATLKQRSLVTRKCSKNFKEKMFRSAPDLSNLSKINQEKVSFAEDHSILNEHFENPIKKDLDDWDANTLVGHIENGNGVTGKTNYKVTDICVEEVIDQLEKILEASFKEVIGVRLDNPGLMYISFKSQLGYQTLAKKGLMELRNGEIRVRLVDACERCSAIRLYSIPLKLPDHLVIRVLNQYGQVVAPIERCYYKGVDISQRVALMYVCKKLPQSLNVYGYQSPVKITSHHQRPTSRIRAHSITPKDLLAKDEFDKRVNIPTSEMEASPSCDTLQSLGDNNGVSDVKMLPGIMKVPTYSEGVFPTTPLNEVTFYRTSGTPTLYDARRRSSAARFHLASNNLKDFRDSDESNQACKQGSQIAIKNRNDSKIILRTKRQSLPWFSCLGN